MGTTTETRINSTQAKDAIYKAHSISSSASEIDRVIDKKKPLLIGGEIRDSTGATLMKSSAWTLFIVGSGVPTLLENTNFTKFSNVSLGIGNPTVGANTLYGYKSTLADVVDMSTVDYLTTWVFVDEPLTLDSTNTNQYGNHLFVVGDTANAFVGFRIEGLNKGWNNITMPKSEFTVAIAGTVNWSNIKQFQLRVDTYASSSGKLAYFNSFIIGGNKLDKIPVCITMDDGGDDSKYMAEIMNTYGIPTSLFVMNNYIDNASSHAGYMTLEDCKYIYNRGNHIGIHGDMLNEFIDHKENIKIASDWLKSNGFTRDSGYLYGSYPNGAVNQDTIDYAKSIGIKALRLIAQRPRNDSINSEGYFYSYGITSLINGGIADNFRIPGQKPINLAGFQSDLTKAISRQSGYITYHHNFTEFVNRNEWISLAKYLKSKVDDGTIECLTFPQFVKKYS